MAVYEVLQYFLEAFGEFLRDKFRKEEKAHNILS